MKIRIVLFLMVVITIVSCKQEKSLPHEGAWQFISSQSFVNDTLVGSFPGDFTGSDVKVWTKNYFVFVGHFKNDSSEINNYGGGYYTLEGNKYSEAIQYHTNPKAIGMDVNMTLEVRNDTLIQIYPVDDQGKAVKSWYTIEKYVRLK